MATRQLISVPSDQVEVEFDGFVFGDQQLPESSTEGVIRVPRALVSLGDILYGESRLLTLEASEHLTKDVVLAAYGHDIDFLGHCMKDLDECVYQAIRASIVFQGERRMGEKNLGKFNEKQVNENARSIWSDLQKQLPAVEYRQVLKLPYTLVAESPAIIITELRRQFSQIMSQVLRRLALHMKCLVEQERIGLVSWAGVDACCYHYFCHEYRESVISQTTHKERTETSPGSGEARIVQKTEVKKEEYLARHIHHLVYATLHDLTDYRQPKSGSWFGWAWQSVWRWRRVMDRELSVFSQPMPHRIREFLDSVPLRVRHLLQIVDGQMTMEEVVARKLTEATVVETQTTAVYRYDPAVLLGDFVLVGWDSKEVEAEQRDREIARKEAWELRKWWWKKRLKVIGICLGALLLIGSVAGSIWYANIWLTAAGEVEKEKLRQQQVLQLQTADNAKKERERSERAALQQVREKYSTYVAEAEKDLPVIETAKERKLDLKGGPTLFYGGIGGITVDSRGGSSHQTQQVSFRVGNEGGKQIVYPLKPIPDTNSSMYYGDIDLTSELGVPLVIHVTRADVVFIHYTVSAVPTEDTAK